MTLKMNKLSIAIIDNSESDFTGKDINTTKVRGTEASIIFLSESFAKKGFNVTVLTCTQKTITHNNVVYLNKNIIPDNIFSLCIAISNANLFYGINADKYVVWSNSLQSIEKFIRKKQLLPFLKYKPKVMTMCNYQYQKRSFFTAYYGKLCISLTVDPVFFNEPVDKNYIPKNIALNNVRSYRNIDWLVDIWKKYIFTNGGKETLFINPNIIENEKDLLKYNIKTRKYVERKELLNELKETKVFVYTGHKSDVWTLTVEEAVQMCVPVVTFGIGSVSDRVKHGENGFLVKTDKEFAYYLKKILNDDSFYLNLKSKMFNNRGQRSWNDIADEWINRLFLK